MGRCPWGRRRYSRCCQFRLWRRWRWMLHYAKRRWRRGSGRLPTRHHQQPERDLSIRGRCGRYGGHSRRWIRWSGCCWGLRSYPSHRALQLKHLIRCSHLTTAKSFSALRGCSGAPASPVSEGACYRWQNRFVEAEAFAYTST